MTRCAFLALDDVRSGSLAILEWRGYHYHPARDEYVLGELRRAMELLDWSVPEVQGENHDGRTA
jgi:hypothetical protein